MQIDSGSAYFGALVTIACVLALIVVGVAVVIVHARNWIGNFLRLFRDVKLDRVDGVVQVQASVIETTAELAPAPSHLLIETLSSNGVDHGDTDPPPSSQYWSPSNGKQERAS